MRRELNRASCRWGSGAEGLGTMGRGELAREGGNGGDAEGAQVGFLVYLLGRRYFLKM